MSAPWELVSAPLPCEYKNLLEQKVFFSHQKFEFPNQKLDLLYQKSAPKLDVMSSEGVLFQSKDHDPRFIVN